MNQEKYPSYQAQTPRQQALDFEQAERWQQLPVSDQEACHKALAQLLSQVISQPLSNNNNDNNEREDSKTTP